jgi:hypothetical protein
LLLLLLVGMHGLCISTSLLHVFICVLGRLLCTCCCQGRGCCCCCCSCQRCNGVRCELSGLQALLTALLLLHAAFSCC